MFDILKKEFDIEMKVWDTIPMEDQDKSIRNLNPILDKLDPHTLTSLFTIASHAKSTAIASCFILKND